MRLPRRSLAAALLASPAAAQGRARVTLILALPEGDPEGLARLDALRAGLGAAPQIEVHWTGAVAERAQRIATEVVAARPDVIVVAGGTAITAVLRETRSIPVVFQFNADPVRAGLVRSMAQPGGNATGFTSFEPGMTAKWIELLRQAAPGLRRVLLLAAENPSGAQMQAAAAPGVEQRVARFASDAEVTTALHDLEAAGQGGLVLLPSGAALARRGLIIDRVNAARIPAIYPVRPYVERGGLMSYSVDLMEQYRGAGGYVARILRGERPEALPVQAPTRFVLVLNQRTARAIGLELPPSLLAAADDILE